MTERIVVGRSGGVDSSGPAALLVEQGYDVACNSALKFGSLLARARAWDAVAVATGHYARVTRDEATGRHLLLRARDAEKDQTDFLWPLTQAQLAAARFPVGELTKDEVRDHARRLGL